jgi:minor extracellular serine protease Vpr
MYKRLISFAVIVLATAISSAQTGQQSVPVLENESSGLWFVELSSPPAIEGTAQADLDRDERSFRSAAVNAGLRYTPGRRFGKLWNGLTVRASSGDLLKMRGLPGVVGVYPVMQIKREQTEARPGPAPDLITALKMTGADIAQSELGLSGWGVTVAVIDGGIDYDHPDLGGCFGPGCRVNKGFDLVGDAFNLDFTSPSYNPTPVPDPFPDDCDGHGTHVSGIIGANGTIKGVAPGVRFHAYRVFGCEGTTSEDIVLEAMEMVLDDGADVLNMSLGSALQWPQNPTARAASRLVRHGIVVVAAIGNDAAFGLYSGEAPAVGKEVIGVASFDNTDANLVAFTVSPDDTKIGYTASAGAPQPPETGTFPIARTGTATTPDDACAALPAGSLTGKVALVRRGGCPFYIKAFNAQVAGAIGVVFYNNAPGILTATVAGVPPITIPTVVITAEKGTLIDARLATGDVDLTWTSLVVSEPQPTGNLISSFSSYGLPPDLSFKPDIGAPGGAIRSTLPLEQGGAGNISGTSMSSPHVAGAVALLLEARPHTSPGEVQKRLQNTARPHLWWGDPTLGLLDNVHRQGAGMLRIDDAILADAIVSPSSLALGEIESGSATRALRISLEGLGNPSARRRNRTGNVADQVTYTLGHEPALATGPNTFIPIFLAGFATLQFSTPTVTLGGQFAKDDIVFVTITPPASPAKLFGGYITLTPDDGGTVLRVPYAGYNGDYQEIPVLTPTQFGFPWLAKVVGANLVNQPAGASFTLLDDDVPFILFHLDHQSRKLRIEILDSTTGQSLGFADDEAFLPRNSAAISFFAFPWDGTVIDTTAGGTRDVPDGAYRVEISVLKALGDPRNPSHTETWLSPPIVIARPIP